MEIEIDFNEKQICRCHSMYIIDILNFALISRHVSDLTHQRQIYLFGNKTQKERSIRTEWPTRHDFIDVICVSDQFAECQSVVVSVFDIQERGQPASGVVL